MTHDAEAMMSEQTAQADHRPKCDHICLKDDDHVERGEPHFYGYELPSPRRSPGPFERAGRLIDAWWERYGRR